MLAAAFISVALVAGPSGPVVQALASYDRGEYLAAATLLERVLGSGVDDQAERHKARLYLAASYSAMGDAPASERVLTVLLREAPTLAIDSALFPPPFLVRIEAVRASLKLQPVEKPVVAPVQPPPLVITRAEPEVPATGGPRRWWWVPASVGVVGAGLGAGLLLVADGNHRRLVTPPTSAMDVLSPTEASRLSQSGSSLQLGGWIAAFAGVAGLATTVLFLAFG